jgi:hypothetical protein
MFAAFSVARNTFGVAIVGDKTFSWSSSRRRFDKGEIRRRAFTPRRSEERGPEIWIRLNLSSLAV